VSRSGFWFTWLLVFIVFIVLGCGIGIFLMFLGSNNIKWAPGGVEKRPATAINGNILEKSEYKPHSALTYEPINQSITDMKNPFIVPGRYNRVDGKKKQQTFLEFQGIIETNERTLGLVRITGTDEVFIVYEGENLIEFKILKITPKTLTYSKDGKEIAVPLRGIPH
jgi:hypothetical protein